MNGRLYKVGWLAGKCVIEFKPHTKIEGLWICGAGHSTWL